MLRCLVEIVQEAEADYRPEDNEVIAMIYVLGAIEEAAGRRELHVLAVYDRVDFLEARWSRRFLLAGSWNRPRPWAPAGNGGVHTPTGVRVHAQLRERRDLPTWLAEREGWPDPHLVWLEGERVGPLWETLERIDPDSALVTQRPPLGECRRVARILEEWYTPGLGYRTRRPLYGRT